MFVSHKKTIVTFKRFYYNIQYYNRTFCGELKFFEIVDMRILIFFLKICNTWLLTNTSYLKKNFHLFTEVELVYRFVLRLQSREIGHISSAISVLCMYVCPQFVFHLFILRPQLAWFLLVNP